MGMLDEWMRAAVGDPAKAERFNDYVLDQLLWSGWILMWEAIGGVVFLDSMFTRRMRTDG